MFPIYRRISVMGSTGSVGTQTLQTIREINLEKGYEYIKVTGLSAGSNAELLGKQAREFGVRLLCVGNNEAKEYLSKELADMNPVIFTGEQGLSDFAVADTDLLVTAVVGIRGLVPTLSAVKKGIDIALANKETLVAGGEIVMAEAAKRNVNILPVDSEHAAVFQCLRGHRKEDVSRLILTASGGPFRGYTKEKLAGVTKEQALGHPTWKMGKKITIDCATMMNKGLEVIEASRLFGFSRNRIDVTVHPQSIVHSMVEFMDGSVKAELSTPDMKLPIIQAISYPDNVESCVKKLDFGNIVSLTFEKPDMDTFRCLKLAYDALEEGGTTPACLNGANEAAVGLFLEDKIGFCNIAEYVEDALEHVKRTGELTIENVLSVDRAAREYVYGRRTNNWAQQDL